MPYLLRSFSIFKPPSVASLFGRLSLQSDPRQERFELLRHSRIGCQKSAQVEVFRQNTDL